MTNQRFDCLVQRFVYYLLNGEFFDRYGIAVYQLVDKNHKAYSDEQSITDFVEFENRSHYICNEPGWEEVANYVYGWLQQQEERIERSTVQNHVL